MKLLRELYEKDGYMPVDKDAIAAVYQNNYLKQKEKRLAKMKAKTSNKKKSK